MDLKDTIELMQSDKYEDRLKAEFFQLLIRIRKLSDYLVDLESGAKSVRYENQKLLLATQYGFMCAYVRTLQDRADEEGIELPDPVLFDITKAKP